MSFQVGSRVVCNLTDPAAGQQFGLELRGDAGNVGFLDHWIDLSNLFNGDVGIMMSSLQVRSIGHRPVNYGGQHGRVTQVAGDNALVEFDNYKPPDSPAWVPLASLTAE